MLGALDWRKSDTYAGPLRPPRAIPYGATLILIHHSNRHSAGGRASVPPGHHSTAGAVSQTVGLAWVRPRENPLAPADYRIKLRPKAGLVPLDLLIEQIDDGFDWKLHGSASDVARQKAIQDSLKGRSRGLKHGQHWLHQHGMDQSTWPAWTYQEQGQELIDRC